MSVIDDYLKNATPSQRAALEHIRGLIQELVPSAEEGMGYGIPTFRYKNKNLIHFAFFKDHLSLFPGPSAIAQFKDELASYKQAKGTIQFTEAKPLPDALIRRIVEANVAAIDGR